MASLRRVAGNRHAQYGLCVVLLVLGTYLPTIMLPLTVQPWVKMMYDIIESFGPDDVVLYGGGPDGAVYWDVFPSAVAVSKHLVRRGCKVIYYSGSDVALISHRDMLRTVYGPNWQNHPDYGKKFIELGYIAGGTASWIAMLRDFKGFLKVDAYGNSLTDYDKLPMMKNINNGYDTKADLGARAGIGYQYYKSIYGNYAIKDPYRGNPYGDKFGGLWIGATQDRAQNIANWRVGMRDGMLGSTQDGAMYELLLNLPGLCMRFQVSYVLGIMFIFVAIIIGNVRNVIIPRMTKRTKEVAA